MAVIAIGTGDGSVEIDIDGYGAFGRAQFGSATGDAKLDPIGAIGPVGTMFQSALAIGAGAGRQFLSDGAFVPDLPTLPKITPVVSLDMLIATSSFALSFDSGEPLASLNGLTVNLTQALTPVFHDGMHIGALLTQTYVMSNPTAIIKNFDLVRYADVDNVQTRSPDGGGRIVVNGEEWLVTTNSPIVSNLNPADFFVAIATDGGNEPTTNRFEVDAFPSVRDNKVIPGVALSDTVYNDGPDADYLIDVGTYDTTGALRTVFSIAPNGSATFVTYTMIADGVCAPIDLLKPDSQRPPRIGNVTISGSTSTHDPYAFNGSDDSTDVDGSGQQLVTVPVGNADTVEITFCEPVANLQASHLNILGLRYGNVPILAANGFSYNTATHTGKWRFSAPLAADQYLISVSDAVTDSDGNHLDGEWINPKFLTTTNVAVSRFPSGNGVPGGTFSFVFTILPGDASLDNWVTMDVDYAIYLLYRHTENAPFEYADFDGDGEVTRYDRDTLYANLLRDLRGLALADWNYDGTVDAADYVIWRHNQNTNVDPWTMGDATGDGLVDNADYQLWSSQFSLQVMVAV